MRQIKLSFEGEKSTKPQVTSPAELYKVGLPLFEEIEIRETLIAVFLNQGNFVIGHYVVSKGGIARADYDVRLVLAVALKGLATSFFLVHNHPSGKIKPSKADEELTKSTKKAAALFNIRLLDHLIISKDDYYSFADNFQI